MTPRDLLMLSCVCIGMSIAYLAVAVSDYRAGRMQFRGFTAVAWSGVANALAYAARQVQ